MRRSTELAAAALLGAVATLSAADGGSSHDDLTSKVRAYVGRFEREAASLVAEEHYVQTFGSETRVTRADFVIVKPSEAGPWLGYRDVFEVDGADVRERSSRLLRILETTAPDSLERAEQMTREGARFNIGPPRTVNAPTMPLEILSARNKDRIRLRVKGPLGDGTPRMLLTIDERPGASIVRTPGGGRVATRGEIVVWPDDGAIASARLEFRHGERKGREVELAMSVSYGAVPAIPVRVPIEMREQFIKPAGSGVASYSNYRRFQTSVRIR